MAVQTVAEAALKVRPDVDDTGLAKDSRRVGEQVGDGLVRGIDGRLRDARGKFVKDGEDAGGSFTKGFAKMMKGNAGSGAFAGALALMAAKATVAAGGVATLTPVVAKLTAALVPAAGAALTLPAALLAVKAATVVVKIATADVGEAIKKGLTGSAKEAKEALEGLPPGARKFAQSITALRPQLKGLRAEVSNNFFLPMQNEVKPLAERYIPLLKRGMGELAGPLGGLGEQFAQSARKANTFNAVRAVFRNTRLAAIELRAGVDPLVQGFAALIRVTSGQLPGMATNLAKVATAAGVWLRNAANSGQIMQIYRNGVTTLRQFGQVLANIGAIAAQVWSVSNASGAGFLQTLINLTGEIRAFLASAQGVSTLEAIFGTLSDVGESLKTSLGAALPAIGESMRMAAPVVSDLAARAAQLIVAFAPALPAFTLFGTTLITAVLPAISSLAGFLESNKNTLAALVPWVALAFAGFRIYAITMIAVTKATAAWNLIQKILNGTMRANPIGIVITAIALLAAGIIYLWKNNETFRKVVLAVWGAIKVAIKAVGDWFTNTLWPSLKRAYDQLSGVIKFFANYYKLQWAIIKAIVLAGVNYVVGRFNMVKNFIMVTLPNAFKSGVAAIKRFWEGLQEAARKPVAFVVNTIINPFLTGFQKIADVFGVKTPGPIRGFAAGGALDQAGGQIPGAPSSKDNRIGWLKNSRGQVVSNIAVATGEFVVNARDTMKALPLLRWINNGMKGGPAEATRRIGRRPTDRPGDGSEGFAFAKGGLVGFLGDVWGAISNPGKAIAAPINALINQIPGGGQVRDVLTGVGRKLISSFTGWLSGGAGGAAGGNVGKAQAFVRAQAGKPYVWASAGPGGYDCSGIVSAAYNVLKGRNPYSHTFSTGSLPGPWFQKGQSVGPLVAGWSHAGQRGASANVGHMAGMIGGLPFESSGSRGVHIGSSARKVNQFANIGVAKSQGGLVEMQKIAKVARADFGAVTLSPGANLIYNGLGQPEPLATPGTRRPGMAGDGDGRMHPDDLRDLADAIGAAVGLALLGTVPAAQTAARRAGRRPTR